MVDDNATSSGTESENSSGNVTIIAETFSDIAPSTTLSSVKSEDSTEQLICKSPQVSKGRQKQTIDMQSAVVERGFSDGIDKSRNSPETICSKSMLTSLQSDISIRDQSEGQQSKLILYLGIFQLLIGVCMVVTGGLVMVHGAALGKSGAGLWSGCFAIATGVLGVLAGINDCYGLYDRQTSRMGNLFLTMFLAFSLMSLAAGNLAAVLAGTGILRDVRRPESDLATEDDPRGKFWPPILSNVGLLLSSVVHCLIALVSVYHTAKRVCACFRPREPFNHNQFDPSYSNLQPPYSVVSLSEKPNEKSQKYSIESPTSITDNRKELSKILEGKLTNPESDVDQVDGVNRNFMNQDNGQRTHVIQSMKTSLNDNGRDPHGVGSYFGSANSKDKLVCSWLGGQPAIPVRVQKVSKSGIKKKKMKQPPMLLMPAGAGNTLGRPIPIPMVPVSTSRLGYATLPMMPAGPHALPPPSHHQLVYSHHPQMYPAYATNDMVRIKRKRYAGSSPSSQGRRRTDQLTRSLERIYRQRQMPMEHRNIQIIQQQLPMNPPQKVKKNKKKTKNLTEADVIRTYTGLDRTIAEQFIVACDESRHSHAGSPDPAAVKRNGAIGDKSDSSGFDTASSGGHSNKY